MLERIQYWGGEPAATDYPARLRRMDYVIEKLLVADEQKDQREEQQAFKETDAKIAEAIEKKFTARHSRGSSDPTHLLSSSETERSEFITKLRQVTLMIREDELRLRTVYFDKGVRDQKEQKLLGKVTLLKRVRDKFSNLADEVITCDPYQYTMQCSRFTENFSASQAELATIVHHKRHSTKDQFRNKFSMTIIGAAVGSMMFSPGIGTAFGALIGFFLDRMVSIMTNWNGGQSVTQKRYAKMANTVHKDGKSDFSRRMRLEHESHLPRFLQSSGARTLYVLKEDAAVPAADAKVSSVHIYPSKTQLAHMGSDGVIVPGVDSKTLEPLHGYDSYRQYIATHESPEVIAQIRPRQ